MGRGGSARAGTVAWRTFAGRFVYRPEADHLIAGWRGAFARCHFSDDYAESVFAQPFSTAQAPGKSDFQTGQFAIAVGEAPENTTSWIFWNDW